MKQIYTSLLAMLLLCAWTPSQADEDCENRYRQLQSQYQAEKQAAQLKYEQVFAKTNHWFKEAKRNAPSVKAMYRMRTKHDEAIAALDKGYGEKLKWIQQNHQGKLARLNSECNSSKQQREKVKVDETIAPARERKVIQQKQPDQVKAIPAVDEPDLDRGKPKKKSKRKVRKAKEAEYEATVNSLINEAEKYLNTRYTYGGNSPQQGFDCSGYVKYIYSKYGVNLPRVSREQAKQGTKVKPNEAAPGDLIYFGPRKGKITHIGIVVSQPGKSLKMIHASSSNGVEIAYIDGVKYWEKRVQGFRRVLKP
jgi:N-acetylmuramoyl-L-alanine amidase